MDKFWHRNRKLGNSLVDISIGYLKDMEPFTVDEVARFIEEAGVDLGNFTAKELAKRWLHSSHY